MASKILLLAAAFGLSQAATNDQWAQKSIYQVITDRFARPDGGDADCDLTAYCGGTWSGIVNKLDYIADMGFTAIQISPIVENIPGNTTYGEAFHGYWSQNNYALNKNFGTADDLNNLVKELHNRNMYLLVDVVANEMAANIGDEVLSPSTKIDYTKFVPFNQASDYNPPCSINDWNNYTMYTTCWLGNQSVATPTLKLTDSQIANTQNNWIKQMVANYSIDGIRLDGTKQIPYGFIEPFVKASGVFPLGEVYSGDAGFVCGYQNMTAGLENYPVYGTVLDAFTKGKMQSLVDMIGTMRTSCPHTQYLANFLENQDIARMATLTPDINLDANAMAFILTFDGIPKIYYGSEQHLEGAYSPGNRQPLWAKPGYDTSAPLYKLISNLNKLRNHAISVNSNLVTNQSMLLHSDASTYAARKGPNGVQIVSVLSNQGKSGKAYQLAIPGAADEGTQMTEVLGCTKVTAGNNGTINVQMEAGAPPKVFFPTFNLKGSGLCGTEAANNNSGSSNSSSDDSGHHNAAPRTAAGLSSWTAAGILGLAAMFFL
ncbi:MAG: hypothetical protein Q9227_004263 [Pyrenula ochraceoflavens]